MSGVIARIDDFGKPAWIVLMVLGFGMIVSVLLGKYGATNATF